MNPNLIPLKTTAESIAKTIGALEKFSEMKTRNEAFLRVYGAVNLENDCKRMKKQIQCCVSNINRLFHNLDNLNTRMNTLLN
jgi:hypothetical protein